MKLKREFRDRWVAALRSGEFKQSRRRLARNINGEQTYCVIGVACQLDVKDGLLEAVDEWDRYYEENVFYYHVPGSDVRWWHAPPADVRLRWGLSGETMDEIMQLNDQSRVSFEALADYLDTLEVE